MTNAEWHFHVGMDVVCVDDQVPIMGGGKVKDATITEGHIYKIRWVGMASHYVFGEYLGVKLEGIDGKFGEPWGQKDAPFAARRFRPLIKDRLASLRGLLNGGDPVPSIEEPKRERIKIPEEV